MNETTTVAIVAVAALGLFIIYQNQQQQQAENQVLLAKALTQPTVVNAGGSSNPLTGLAALAGTVAKFFL